MAKTIALRDRRARKAPDAEWQSRCELAAAYRMTARYRMTDLVDGFIGARVAGEPEAFLVKPYSQFAEEVTASSLLKLNFDGDHLDGRNEEANEASIRMCAAVLRAQPETKAVLHAHTKAVMAVAATKGGLLPISQPGFMFHGRLATSPFAFDATEEYCERLLADLGDKRTVLLLNHGMMTVGRTVAEAFFLAYSLNNACEVQIAAQMTGRELLMPSPEECESLAQCYSDSEFYQYDGSREWDALVRQLDRTDPSYRT